MKKFASAALAVMLITSLAGLACAKSTSAMQIMTTVVTPANMPATAPTVASMDKGTYDVTAHMPAMTIGTAPTAIGSETPTCASLTGTGAIASSVFITHDLTAATAPTLGYDTAIFDQSAPATIGTAPALDTGQAYTFVTTTGESISQLTTYTGSACARSAPSTAASSNGNEATADKPTAVITGSE